MQLYKKNEENRFIFYFITPWGGVVNESGVVSYECLFPPEAGKRRIESINTLTAVIYPNTSDRKSGPTGNSDLVTGLLLCPTLCPYRGSVDKRRSTTTTSNA